MEIYDNYHPTGTNDYDNTPGDKILSDLKKLDRGYNKVYRNIVRKDNIIKRTGIEVYTSGGFGSQIRDAESGNYYSDTVGSAQEDLYFSVILATGECKSSNGSSTLFYLSPTHYERHFHTTLSPEIINKWTVKNQKYLSENA
uniref:Uncharacterized protein n=1 Tax=viral metagenome TaxID=1070528 RepID=A0A6C0ESG6_9ZZZZ